MGVEYAAVPQSEQQHSGVLFDALDSASYSDDEGGHHNHNCSSGIVVSRREIAKRAVVLVGVLMAGLALGFCVGRQQQHPGAGELMMDGGQVESVAAWGKNEGGALLPPSAFVPEIPMKDVVFEFPTPYEDPGVAGDKLWDALMPLGSGFVRVPHPRQYDMPASKPIENDPQDAEIYSLSVLHQLHCLGVIRDVVLKYEKKSKSRFAGKGHEYHCIDYIRQSVMCAGDMTLDFAELHDDGSRRGFSGANSTHQCRDWEGIVAWAVENREGDKKGIA